MSTVRSPGAPAAGVSSRLESSHLWQALLLALWGAFWSGIQILLTAQGVGAKAQLGLCLLGMTLALGGAFLVLRHRFLNLLSSIPFAITQICILSLGVALGAGAGLRLLPLGDVFHNLGFLALQALLSLSMLVVAWKRRPYGLARTGFLLVHIAPSFVLLGGLWGLFTGVKARVELKAGQGTYTFQPLQPGKPFVLPGFQVRLERFECRRSGSVRLLASGGQGGPGIPIVAEAQEGKLPGGLEFRVERLIPEAIELGRLAVPPLEGRDPDVLLVVLGVGGPEPLLGALHAFGTEAFRRDEPLGRFAVLFRERLDPSLLGNLRPHPPRGEMFTATFGGRTVEVSARAGQVLPVAGATLRVVALYPDFQVRQDGAGNPVMSSRSLAPRDPWLEVELSQPGRAPRRVLLSARQPEYTDRLNAPNLPEGLNLRYSRKGEETQARFVVFSREGRRVALVESGTVVREGAWELKRPFLVASGLSVTPVGLFDAFSPAPAGLSVSPGRAALRVKVTDPLTGVSERGWLRADEEAQAFLGGRVNLQCLQALPAPQEIRSTLLVVDPQGRELARRVVSVNDPLVYDGLSFLQSSQGSRDPEASAILVVDPAGVWLAGLGYALLFLGLPWMFYLKPWLKGRREGGAR